MPISSSLLIHPKAILPVGSQLRLRTDFFTQIFPLVTPASFHDWYYAGPVPKSDPFTLWIDFIFGTRPAIPLTAANLLDDLLISFSVLPGSQIDPRYYCTGNITHKKGTGCAITCLNEDNQSPSSGPCAECENEDAVVKVCC
jgi:hypothetical protein